MIRRTSVWVAILALSTIALLMVVSCRPREPVSGGKPLSYWLPRLDNRSDATARAAIKEMGANALPYLIQTLQQPQPPVDKSRVRGLSAISCLGPVGKPALPDILPLLTNQSYPTKIWAFFALKSIGPDTPTVNSMVPILFQALEDKEWTMRLAALNALAALRPPPSEVTPAFVELLKDRDRMVRGEAMNCLIAQTNTIVIPILDKQLHEKDKYAVITAASQIGTFGPDAAGSEPRLRELLTDPLLPVRQAASNALAAITGQAIFQSAPEKKMGRTFDLPSVPLPQFLDIYEDVAGRKVAIAASLQGGQILRLKTVRPLTKSETLQLFDEVLKEQAGLIIVHGPDGSLSAVATPMP